MSKQAYNGIFKDQQKKLVRAVFKKAFINAVNVSSRTVDVSFAENPQTVIRGISVSNNVTIANVVAGQRCRVDVFDENNPNDMVLAYTY